MNIRIQAAPWFAVLLLLPWLEALAVEVSDTAYDQPEQSARIDEVIVLGKPQTSARLSVPVADIPVVDTSEVLRRLPGADVNWNGRITGIAQYRGMYGDRVAVTIDGIGLISGGPNAMDTPLSYMSPMLTEEVVLERGMPGVANSPDGIGGHLDARLARGEFGQSDDFNVDGMLGLRYSASGDATTIAGRTAIANRRHRVSLIGETDHGSDVDTPAGRIYPSLVDRTRYDLSYGYRGDSNDVQLFAGGLQTTDSGTPALAMDIRDIDANLYGIRVARRFGSGIRLHAMAGYNDVDHSMDNFSLRTAPGSPMDYRHNHARGKGGTYEISLRMPAGEAAISVGLDGRRAQHDSRITNPNNAAFFVSNFNDVQRDSDSIFAVVSTDSDAVAWEIGARFTRTRTNAGAVDAGGMMGMMAQNVIVLADAFNGSDLGQTFAEADVVLIYRRPVSHDLDFNVTLGSRTRAPSYQELYLWLPLPATGGLADGRSYVGNPQLSAERNNEISLGLDWSTGRFGVAPQIYYRDIDDYIQGVPTGNMVANMVATMMTGSGALEFANVDARIYGIDLDWRYDLSEQLLLEGNFAYTRGQRTDVVDNLYRLAPLSAGMALSYLRDRLTLRTELFACAAQDKVSAYNQESPSAGYAILNVGGRWQARRSLRFELQLTNLTNRAYQHHVTGVNRVQGADIPAGQRLYGASRSLTLGAVLSF